MSPRNDTYLSLCLHQASLSPLHFRHGAIIVRGGKIIGQGFNTYSPGYDGGALRTGVLGGASLDMASMLEFKQKLKSNSKFMGGKEELGKQDNQPVAGTFTPFEAVGGTAGNAPLSMHSEMMAIRSALSLSSGTQSSYTSARSSAYCEKPHFLSGEDSKQRKVRAKGIKAYAKAICEEASSGAGIGQAQSTEFSIQKSGFEPGASQPGVHGAQCVQRHGGVRREHGTGYGEKYWETSDEGEEGIWEVCVPVQQAFTTGGFVTTLST